MKETVCPNIDDVKKEISGKSKAQKLNIIRQAKTNLGLLQNSNDNSYNEKFEAEINALLNEIENDNSFKYDVSHRPTHLVFSKYAG